MQLLLLPRRVAIVYATLIALALLVYSAAWTRAPIFLTDSYLYLETARDLSDGSLSDIPYRTIGYPLFLLATGSLPDPGKPLFYCQLALHVLVIWLGGVILYRTGASFWLTVGFAVIMLLPPYMLITGYVMTECLAQFLMMGALAGFYLYVRESNRSSLILSSFACTGATLARPGYQLFSVALGVLMLAAAAIGAPKGSKLRLRRTAADVLLLVVFPLLTVAGYSAFNSMRFGYFGLTPLLGHNLAVRTAPFYDKVPEQDVKQLLLNASNELYVGGANPDLAVFGIHDQLLRKFDNSRVRLAKYLQHMGAELIRREKFEYLMEVGRSLGGFWFPRSHRTSGVIVERWWEQGASGITFKNAKAVPRLLPIVDSLVVVWQLVELVIAGLFLTWLVLFPGVLAAVVLFRHPQLKVPAPGAAVYAACSLIVIYNAVISCALDAGRPHQRGSTEAFLVLAALLGVTILQNLLRSRKGAGGIRLSSAE